MYNYTIYKDLKKKSTINKYLNAITRASTVACMMQKSRLLHYSAQASRLVQRYGGIEYSPIEL